MVRAALIALPAMFAFALGAACGGALSEDEMRQKIGPSLVRIQDGFDAIGSGFLVEGGYVVTAAHVAWPYTVLDVVFEDGTAHEDVPVLAHDHFADLAFLGPIDTYVPTLDLVKTETLRRGDTVLSIGHALGSPSLYATRGEYEGVFLGHYEGIYWGHLQQTDPTHIYSTAESIGGMSGGVMTNGDGDVIGIVALGGENLTVGPSSDVILDGLNRVVHGMDLSPLGSRLLPDAIEGSYQHEFTLQGRWDTAIFWSRGSRATVEIDASSDVEYALFDQEGPQFPTVFRSAEDGVAKRCCHDGPWFIVVRQSNSDYMDFPVLVRSSTPLARYDDPDDEREVGIARKVFGAIDTPGDIDRYRIQLSRGQVIVLRIVSFDSLLVEVDYLEALPHDTLPERIRSVAYEVKYRAAYDGEYTVAVKQDEEYDASTIRVYSFEVLASTWAGID